MKLLHQTDNNLKYLHIPAVPTTRSQYINSTKQRNILQVLHGFLKILNNEKARLKNLEYNFTNDTNKMPESIKTTEET